MARKMPRRLVALSSSAIATIYFAGFVATRSADAGIPTAADTGSSTTPAATAAPTATATTAMATAPNVSPYADGTYAGTGTSRRGNVSVSVTVASGKISNVTLTGVTTEYPVARIAGLPAQVVSRQSAQVDSVSGATYSAQAFRLAVQAALARASA
jgi:uncharacterized protein with FMN-binding domain